MYGFIHCALADMIQKKYGETKWKEILFRTGIELDGGSFLIHSMYPDEDTDALLVACCDVLGEERDVFLEAFGCHFMVYCFDSGYDGILRVLGATLFDFLRNLDALHNHLASIYPGLCAPAFRCELRDESHILLHYHSQRADLYPIAIGLVRSIAKELYDTDVEVSMIRQGVCHGRSHVVILVADTRRVPVRQRINSFSGKISWITSASFDPADSKFSADFFCKAFPFHVMINRDLQFVQAGRALLRHLKMRNCTEPFNLKHLFDIDRPILNMSFADILNHVDNLFVLVLKPEHGRPLRLKGQMLHVHESDSVLFLCSPKAQNLTELRQQGLYLSDIPIHDKTREVLLLQDAGWMERELVEKLEETTNNLKKLQTKLTEDKDIMDDLVHSILPTNVAQKLRRHESIEADRFDMVSILYTDVVEFTALCGDETVQPMDIVRLLNKLYSEFDTIGSTFGAFKVETIGDAYLVAVGIPEYQPDHADRIIDVALAMMESSKEVMLPTNKGHIQIRMGVNSGPCIAGVVGKKMPRYCLFGNTITLTCKVEMGSRPGKINISHNTKGCVLEPNKYSFEENTVQELPCRCFFVKANQFAIPSPTGTGCSSLPGLFCSPCASPAGSRRTSADMGSEPLYPLPDHLTMPAKIHSRHRDEDRRATIGAKIQYYSVVEAMLREKLGSQRSTRSTGGARTQPTYGHQIEEGKNWTLPLPNVRLPRRSASTDRERRRNSFGTSNQLRRSAVMSGKTDNQETDISFRRGGQNGCVHKMKPSPLNARQLNPPVEIRLTPPPQGPFSDDEESHVLEIDGEKFPDRPFSPQSKHHSQDFSIFCLPRIQETLDRKLQAVCRDKTDRKWDLGSSEGIKSRQRLSSSDSLA